MDFTKEEAVCIIFLSGSLKYKKVVAEFNKRFPDRKPVTKKQVKEINKYFQETGSVPHDQSTLISRNLEHMDHFLSGLEGQNGAWPPHRLYAPEFSSHANPAVSNSTKPPSTANSLIVPSSSRATFVKHEANTNDYEELEAFNNLQTKALSTKTKDKPEKWDTKKMCPICSKILSRGDKLRNHMRIHTNNFPYTCDTCGTGFLRAEGLRVHMRIHTGERPYVCQVCGNSYTRKDKLTRHAINHTGQRPFECPICSKTFTRKDKMQRHCLIHKQAEKPFTCMPCNLEFNSQKEFHGHNTKKHPDRLPFTPAQLNFTNPQLPTLVAPPASAISLIPIPTSTCNK